MNKVISILLLIFSTLSFAVEGDLYVSGEVVKPLSLSLEVSSIDFGDVYTDTEVESVPVNFYVDAEAGIDYQVEISSDDESEVVQISRTSTGGYTGGTLTYDDIGTGVDQTHEFYVDLDTGSMDSDLSATITVMVVYFEIT